MLFIKFASYLVIVPISVEISLIIDLFLDKEGVIRGDSGLEMVNPLVENMEEVLKEVSMAVLLGMDL